MDVRSRLHEGERFVQEKRNTPTALAELVPDYIDPQLPDQHAEFYENLDYLPIASLDHRGRPWATILVTRSPDETSTSIDIKSDQSGLEIRANIADHDPFMRGLQSGRDSHRLFAAVGVDFTNRRRNKVAGHIQSFEHNNSQLKLDLTSDQHLGNCPKYITVRSLLPFTRTSDLAFDEYHNFAGVLPTEAKGVIAQASTLFLATYYASKSDPSGAEHKMGLNHRGGSPGFMRIRETVNDAGQPETELLIPDHSGNRFYQSLGNIQGSGVAGMVITDFNTGDLLYVTGTAQNLFDDEARAVMPRVSLVTRLKITGAVLIKGALNLKLDSEELMSPYNPPLQYLKEELESVGAEREITLRTESTSITATLKSVTHLTTTISTFNFELSAPISQPLPSGFGVFDFSKILDGGYQHMNDANPQSLNDDFIRTWTLSSAPAFDPNRKNIEPANELSITVKRKPNGLISPFLHHCAAKRTAIQVDLKGTGEGFGCFEPTPSGKPSVPRKMLWVAGGVGITPFLSMWQALIQLDLSTDIILVYAGRDDDLMVLNQFNVTASPSISISAYQSIQEKELAEATVQSLRGARNLQVQQTRITEQALQIADLHDREIYLCGPNSLMESINKWLAESGYQGKINQESYAF